MMKHCARAVALLADYLEHRLPPEVHADLERHLAACKTCITQLHTYESTVSLLRSLHEEDLPRELRFWLRSFLDARSDHN
jgi:anti-sigma factor RsiW